MKLSNFLTFYRVIFIGVVVLCILLIAPLTKLSIIPSFFDELVLFGILLYAIYKSFSDDVIKYVLLVFGTLFIIYVLMSMLSSPNVGIFKILLQTFIHLKYMLFFIFLWSFVGPDTCLKLAYATLAVTIMFLLLNLLSGSLFNEIFETKITLRSELVRPIGIQADTGNLGITFSLLGCLFVCGNKLTSRWAKVAILIAFTLLILMSSTRTGLVLIPLVVLWWLRDSIKSFFIAIVLLISSVFFISSSNYMDEMINITIENIEWTIDDPVASSYIRGIMIYFAFDLAADRFPLGTGAATYGTVMSDDSAVYAEIGLQNSRFFIDKDGIYDSNFASILGEFGYIGLLLYFWAFYKVINAPFRGESSNNSESEFRFVIYLLISAYCITTPIFMNTYPAFLFTLVIVASYKLQRRNTMNKAIVKTDGNPGRTTENFKNLRLNKLTE
ncbi:O-antigen ligase family protein [Litorilituus lipolyticus]|uniref:O-antigen ligase-related domain-containing protein n=1 Tax=Litorilituus lipolyticus TaxID=2491017 RepID=A0A502L3V4_9GAMM|nr:O-antigen ligase family protein [Litorilituus lipolyticus]TPH17075.1 hypothetical protein EPA86_05170 [Litorilituus lipolyticus]